MPENEKRPLRESAGVHDVEEYCNCNLGERSTAGAASLHPVQSALTFTICRSVCLMVDEARRVDHHLVDVFVGCANFVDERVGVAVLDAFHRGPKVVDAWLQMSFYRSETELGGCLRLPEEGSCECDLLLRRGKFFTTGEHASRLRRREHREQQRVDTPAERGWAREVERHIAVRGDWKHSVNPIAARPRYPTKSLG